MLAMPAAELRTLEAHVRAIAARFAASRAEAPVMPADPHAARNLSRALPRRPSPRLHDELEAVAAACRHNDSPRFWGYVMGSGNDVGALGDALGATLNQNVTAWRSAPAATEIEILTVDWLGELVGYAPPHAGYFIGGGSLANLAGLAMARASRLPEAGRTGLPGGPRVAVYASSEVHLSIAKACDLLGLGRSSLRLLPVDPGFRLVPDALEDAIARDRSEGVVPVAVVASAGTVNTGAVDPLAAVAQVCRRQRVWLHVDGAYGALAAAARPAMLAGLSEADSVSLDCHKWLCTPMEASCLLYRDRAAARRAFQHQAAYTTPLADEGIESFAFFDESPELSRPFRALKVWMMLSAFGADAFRDAIERNLLLARQLGELVASSPDFELCAPVALSVCCFRHRSDDESNRRLLDVVNRRGRFYLSSTEVSGRFVLRACITNHETTEADVAGVLDELRAAASPTST